jgi:hypothetical protein
MPADGGCTRLSALRGEVRAASCNGACGREQASSLDRLRPVLLAFSNLCFEPELAGDRRDRQALSMKIKNHDDFPKFDHRTAPSFSAERDWVIGDTINWGIFQRRFSGVLLRHQQRSRGIAMPDACDTVGRWTWDHRQAALLVPALSPKGAVISLHVGACNAARF